MILDLSALVRILTTSLVILWLVSYFIVNPLSMTLSYAISFLITILMIYSPPRDSLMLYWCLLIWSLVALAIFIVSRTYYLTQSFGVITIILNIWIGIALARFGAFFSLLRIIFVAFCLYTLYELMINQINPNSLLTASQNHISIVVLSLLAISNLDNIQQGKLNSNYVYLTTLVCIIALGRAGIITGIFILLSVSGYNLYHSKAKQARKFLAVILFMLCAAIIFIYLAQQGFFQKFIISALNSSNRTMLISEYFDSFSIYEFFLGRDVNFARDIDPRLSIHNSYLGIHMVSGFAGIMLIYSCIALLLPLARKNLLASAVIIAILVRALTDNFLFTYHFISGSVVLSIFFQELWSIGKNNIYKLKRRDVL